jgi:hypothetical protein
MKRLSDKEVERVISLRESGKTISEIAVAVERNKSTIHYWIRGTSANEAYLVESRKRMAKSISNAALRKRLEYQKLGREAAKRNDSLHTMGCMLYWAEGSKRGNSIVFANSDPDMISIFMRFLRESLLADDSDIRIRLNCYVTKSTPFRLSVEFWKSITGLPDKNFTKSTTKRGDENEKHRHGICYISISRADLVQHIYGAIQEYIKIDKPEFAFLGLMERSKTL